MNEHDDDDAPESEEEFNVYDVDPDTRGLIEAACNCIASLAQAQLDETSAQNLLVIADALAERFGLDSIELEEHHHTTEDGEEVLLAPKGGVFPELPEEEGEAPKPE